MLSSRVFTPRLSELLEQEDLFECALNTLFTDDTQVSHGTPGQSVTYRSPSFGDIALRIPAHPDVEEGRQLFAHYLWNAGVIAAEGIECASRDAAIETRVVDENQTEEKVVWEGQYWDVRGQNVLELGAGTALPSLIAALSNAQSVTITDHPSSPAIATDTIKLNVRANLHENHPASNTNNSTTPSQRTSTTISIHGYVWGESSFVSSTTYGKASDPQPVENSFNKIIIADCLWMASQHVNLVKTILLYLTPNSGNTTGKEAKRQNCALVIAGFHTGRSTVAEFFRIATGSRDVEATDLPEMTGEATAAQQNVGGDDGDDTEEVKAIKGSLRAASIFEVDVDCSVRPWQPIRSEETKEQAKRWCVVAALMQR